ncbi:MAG: hypothetical protein M3310_01405, partial [Actinomycetota bacterium]|nr:hypothetical protein [Actinomycetota bacterium]
MADVAAPSVSLRRARLSGWLRDRTILASASAGVVVLVAIGFAVRAALAARHATPTYLPDEYIYSELARSLARGNGPTIRGEPASFPALLEPLLAAPLWLVGGIEVTYRLTQALHSLTAALAAVPAYLLARRLQLPTWLQLAAAALTLAFPALLYTAHVVADPVAYPFALASVYAGVAALDRPTKKTQLAFLAVATLTSFTRVQYVVVPVAFAAAAAVVERGRIREVAVKFWPTLLVLAGSAAVVGAAGAPRLLGYYGSVTGLALDPARIGAALAVNGYGLLWASGWVLVPGAAIAIFLALLRPRSRAESAFAAMFLFVALALLFEAALYAANGELRFKERYLMSLLPLVVIAFGVFVARGLPAPRVLVALAISTTGLSVAVPLPQLLANQGHRDSPFVLAVSRITESVNEETVAFAGVLVAALSIALNVAVGRSARTGPVAVVAAAATLLVAASAFAQIASSERAARTRATYLPQTPSWVDSAAPRGSALLVTPGSPRELGFENLFWNRSVDDVLYL